jgi:hypothetical protein
MKSEKNTIMVINEMFESDLKKNIRKIIESKEAGDSLEYELEYLEQAMPGAGEELNLSYIQNNPKSRYIGLYGYLAGHTNLKVNVLPVLPVVAAVGSAAGGASNLKETVQKVFGTKQSCGIIGGLFNTKKCREKVQQQAGALVDANKVTNEQLRKIAEFGPIKIEIPNPLPSPEPAPAPAPAPADKNNSQIILIAGAILLFLLLKRKKK